MDDSVMALLSYPDGSTASISYLANASTDLPKERWEVHADGKSAVCENFRVTTLPGGKKVRGVNQDKGQKGAVDACCRALAKGLGPVIPIHELIGVTAASLATLESVSSAARVAIRSDRGQSI
jgi:hypothetical protein